MQINKMEWGSHAKFEWLKKKSDELLKQQMSGGSLLLGSVIDVNVQ
jgi:hypothetical protein